MLSKNNRFPDFSTSNLDPLHAKKEELQNSGIQIIDITVSNPTKLSIHFPKEILAHTWTGEFSWDYDPNPKGLVMARQAILKYYQERNPSDGNSISIDDFWITSGTSEAYSFLFKALTKPGDEVLVETPGYPLVSVLAELENCRPIHLDWRGGSSIIEKLESVISSRTKIICLVSPNNPSGKFISDEEFTVLCEFAGKHSIAILIDEVFSEYGLEENQIHFKKLVGKNLDVFLLNGVSKLACLPGWKLGWIYYLSKSIDCNEVKNRLDWLGDSYLSCNSITQELLPTILDSRFLVLNQIKNRIRRNLSMLTKILQGSKWRIEYGGAGWYAQLILDTSQFSSEITIFAINSSKEMSLSEQIALEFLEKENIFMYPGTVFSYPKEAPVWIISLITPEDVLIEAITKLVEKCYCELLVNI